jgi:hypothetical protein
VRPSALLKIQRPVSYVGGDLRLGFAISKWIQSSNMFLDWMSPSTIIQRAIGTENVLFLGLSKEVADVRHGVWSPRLFLKKLRVCCLIDKKQSDKTLCCAVPGLTKYHHKHDTESFIFVSSNSEPPKQ